MNAAEITDRLARAHAGISTRQAAGEWGVSQQTLNTWENGTGFPRSEEHLELVADIVDVDVEVVRIAGRRRNLELRAASIARELEALETELATVTPRQRRAS
jgi:DNA-binding XRE family transcriptional regulator